MFSFRLERSFQALSLGGFQVAEERGPTRPRVSYPQTSYCLYNRV